MTRQAKPAARLSGQRHTFQIKTLSLAIAACLGSAAPAVLANPTGASVASGSATFSTQGNVLTVTNSNGAIINWQQFNIGANETTRFVQPGAQSSVLNRVVGGDPSQIFGTLQSNGQVFLINPNGILFGRNAVIDLPGLVASTLNLSDADFLARRFNFNGGGFGPLVNQGRIATALGGSVMLVGSEVRNEGIITTPEGQVILAAGNSVSLSDTAGPEVSVTLTASGNKALNLGEINAAGGRVDIFGALIEQQGVLRADSASVDQVGRIVLKASQATTVSGTISATNSAGQGGEIQVLGDSVTLTGTARLDASGATGGGTVLVGGDWQGKNAAVPNARTVTMEAGAVIQADAIDRGNGGKVVLWSDEATDFKGSIFARGGANGGDGGRVETSGRSLQLGGTVDTRAPKGAMGFWLLDPAAYCFDDYNMSCSYMAPGATFVSTANVAQALQTSSVYYEAGDYINILSLSLDNPSYNGGYTTQTGATLGFKAPHIYQSGTITAGNPLHVGMMAVGTSASYPTYSGVIKSYGSIYTKGGEIKMDAAGALELNSGTFDVRGMPGGFGDGVEENFWDIYLRAPKIVADGKYIYGNDLFLETNSLAFGTYSPSTPLNGQIDWLTLGTYTPGTNVLIGTDSSDPVCTSSLCITTQFTSPNLTVYDGIAVVAGRCAAGGGDCDLDGAVFDGDIVLGTGGPWGFNSMGDLELFGKNFILNGPVTVPPGDRHLTLFASNRFTNNVGSSGIYSYGGTWAVVLGDEAGSNLNGLSAPKTYTTLAALMSYDDNEDWPGPTGIFVLGSQVPSSQTDPCVANAALCSTNSPDKQVSNVADNNTATGSSASIVAPLTIEAGLTVSDSPTTSTSSTTQTASAPLEAQLAITKPDSAKSADEVRAEAKQAREDAGKAGSEARKAEAEAKQAEAEAKQAETEAKAARTPAQKAAAKEKAEAKKAEAEIKKAEAEAKKAEAEAKLAEAEGREALAEAKSASRGEAAGPVAAKQAQAESKQAQAEAKQAEAQARKAEAEGKQAIVEARAAKDPDRKAVAQKTVEAKKMEAEARKTEAQAKQAEAEAKQAEAEARTAPTPQARAAAEKKAEGKRVEAEVKKTEAEGKLAQAEGKQAEAQGKEAQVQAKAAQVEAKQAEAEAKAAKTPEQKLAASQKAEVKKTEAEAHKATGEAKQAEAEGKRMEAAAKQAEVEAKKAEAEVKQAKAPEQKAAAEKRAETKRTEAEVKKTEAESKLAQAEGKQAEARGKQAEVNAKQAEAEAKQAEQEARSAKAPEQKLEATRKAEVKKTEAEAHKTAGEARKAEAEGKRIEAEAKKAEAEVKRAEAEVKQAKAPEQKAAAEGRAEAKRAEAAVKKAEAVAKQTEAEAKEARAEAKLAEAEAKGTRSPGGRAVVEKQAEAKKAEGEHKLAEAAMKKAEAEVKKAEVEVKKAEAVARKAEAEGRKVEARARKIEAETKKAEAQARKTEVEARKAEAELKRAEAARKREEHRLAQEKRREERRLESAKAFAAVATAGANRAALANLAALRHELKGEALKPALSILAANPAAADLPPCGAGNVVCVPSAAGAAAALPPPLVPKFSFLPQIQRKVALVVGVNKYADPAIPSLESALPDAEAVGRQLQDQLGYEVKVLPDASRADIVTSLNRLSQEVGPNDSVTVYYAGHGYLNEKTKTGYWIPADAKVTSPSNWISNSDIAKLLANIPAKQVLLVSDSCYSGSLAKEQKLTAGAGSLDPSGILAKRSVTVMASGGEEPVSDEGKEGHSIFAFSFMNALKSVKEFNAGARLFETVRNEVSKDYPQTPQYGGAVSAGHTLGGDYLFEARSYK